MKELKDIVLKKYDILYFDDGDDISVNCLAGTTASELKYKHKITKIERPVKYETIYETILNKEEKEYLEAVIKPFKDMVDYIVKLIDCFGDECIYIFIRNSKTNESICFPSFKKGTMYKGMESDKEYTLKELGLFEE